MFMQIPVQNIFNTMHDYKATTHFKGKDLGKDSLIFYSCKHSKSM